MKITGVDNDTYSLTGEAFSHIASPNSTSATPRKLQEDDVALGARRPLSNWDSTVSQFTALELGSCSFLIR